MVLRCEQEYCRRNQISKTSKVQFFSTFKYMCAKSLTLYFQAPTHTETHTKPLALIVQSQETASVKAAFYFFSSSGVMCDSDDIINSTYDLHMVKCADSEVMLPCENHISDIHKPHAVGKLFCFSVSVYPFVKCG